MTFVCLQPRCPPSVRPGEIATTGRAPMYVYTYIYLHVYMTCVHTQAYTYNYIHAYYAYIYIYMYIHIAWLGWQLALFMERGTGEYGASQPGDWRRTFS